MPTPDVTHLAGLSPRARWFLHAILAMRPLGMRSWQRFDQRLPEWDDAESPLPEILQALDDAGWIEKDEDGDPVATEPARALMAEVAAAAAGDLSEWWRRVAAQAIAHAEAPEGQALHRAILALDRAACVPESERPLAVCDMPIPLSEDMTESALHAVAMTLAAVEPRPGERVLLCGVKGGSLAVVAAQMVGDRGSVVALDWDADIAAHARRAVEAHGLTSRVDVLEQADVTAGLPARGPWHVIVLNGSIPRVPYELMHQLDDVEGRILFFLHNGHESSECWVIRKNDAVLREEKLSRFRFTPIPGRNGFDTIRDLQEQYEAARRVAESAAADLSPMATRVPYPLSRAFLAAHNAIDVYERHERVLKVGEVLTKYLAISVVSACASLGAASPKVGVELRKLANKPAWGHWMGVIRELGPLAGDHPVGRAALQEYERAWKHRAMAEAFQALQHETGHPGAGQPATVRLRELLDKLVEYRNKTGSGHGNTNSERQSRQMSDLLLRALAVVLMEGRFFQDWSLYAILRNERAARRQVLNLMNLRGTHNLSERWELPVEVAGGWRPAVALFPSSGPDARAKALELHPWLVWTEGKNHAPELFTYNNSRNGQYEYITYHNKDEFPPTEIAEDFDELLIRFPEPPRPKVDPAHAQALMGPMLALVVADGKVTADELAQLRLTMVSFGLAPDPEAAEAMVREIIAREHPGVWFEE
jgi:protein-L-isoaspartate(D-aspartate) O-methyltransferase